MRRSGSLPQPLAEGAELFQSHLAFARGVAAKTLEASG